MSNTSEDLLIIYESEAEQWASYLQFHLTGPIPETGICCYDIAMVTSRQDDFLRLGKYKCKLLILSRGMLEGLCQLRRFFLARVLRPETRVIILLCGVESLDPLLELVPLKGEECLQISSEQEPQDYRLAVAEIVCKGGQAAAVDGRSVQVEKKLSSGATVSNQTLLVLPSRVPCGNPGKIFILLQEIMAGKDAEVEFSGNKKQVRVKPVNWNESTLSVTAPECSSDDIPTLLHFAAKHGLQDLASALLQCPGSRQALKVASSHGYTPLDLAHVHGHNKLYILLQESLVFEDSDGNIDTGVYELMGRADNLQVACPDEEHQNNDDENVYTPLGRDEEEYDAILTSSSSVVIVNRPPAPTPRPDALPSPEDNTPFIAQVFQKKKSQGDAEMLYSLPTRQVRQRDSISSTYDTFVPSHPPGLDELIKLQEEVKTGTLSIDDALDRFNDWQRLQKGMDSVQQEKIQQLRASIISNREDDESVYGKFIALLYKCEINYSFTCIKRPRLIRRPQQFLFEASKSLQNDVTIISDWTGIKSLFCLPVLFILHNNK
ncbi:B-cell scaffold protein with ankyrin repeats-like isoform X4 [Pseudorasbora parva]|uniref:B-cell scaffold protein with ankyrin repeats-like isoform X4 n=1 Tax=Pseudorasbora parva TaxID=51549 RepID=UPI00351F67C4